MCRLERPEKHSRAHALFPADDIAAPVDPIGAVDVEPPGRAEHRRVAPGPTSKGVTRWIVGTVRLGLDNHAADAVNEKCPADERRRNVVRLTREELSAG
jgi:hypothetical protein